MAGAPYKIDDTRLLKYLDQGLSKAEIARRFDVHPTSVTNRIDALQKRKTQVLVVDRQTEAAISREMDVLGQLAKINALLNDMLDAIERDETGQVVGGIDDALRLSAGIRADIKLYTEIKRVHYDMQEVARFQQVILDAIGRADPVTKSSIIQELNETVKLRGVVKFS